MRIGLLCPKCTFGGNNGRPLLRRYPTLFDETGVYRLQCENGHVSTLLIQAHKFEVLAEIATQAIANGYHREGVVSFSSSLERFYEFCTHVIWIAYGKSEESRSRAWKLVGNSSERQLGLFAGVYSLSLGTDVPVLDRKQVEFRNRVVHQGEIPNPGATLSFGQAVIDLVQPVINSIKVRYPEGVTQRMHEVWHAAIKRAELQGEQLDSFRMPMIFKLVEADENSTDLGKAVAQRRADEIHAVAI